MISDPEVAADVRRQFRQAYRRHGLPIPADLYAPGERPSFGDTLDVLSDAMRRVAQQVRIAWAPLGPVRLAVQRAVELERAHELALSRVEVRAQIGLPVSPPPGRMDQ